MLKSGLLRCCLYALTISCCLPDVTADDESQTLLFRAEGRSANDLAKAAGKILVGDEVSVAADPETNVLIVRGAKESVQKTTELLRSLDRIPEMVTIDVEISVHDPENDGARKVIDHLRLVTLEDNEAMVQFGQQVAVVTGRQSFGGRGSQVVTKNQQTGSMMQAMPKVGSNGITMKLNIEKSWLEPPTEESDNEDETAVPTPTTYTLSTETTLHLGRGQSQEIAATVSGGTSVREAIIEVTASVGQPARPQPNVREDASSRGRSSRPSGGESRGRSDGRGGAGAAGRGGFGGRREGPSPTGPGQSADRMFDQFDQNKDGEINGNERERVERLLETLGFDASDEVTRESLAEKIRDRISKRSRETTSEFDALKAESRNDPDKDSSRQSR